MKDQKPRRKKSIGKLGSRCERGPMGRDHKGYEIIRGSSAQNSTFRVKVNKLKRVRIRPEAFSRGSKFPKDQISRVQAGLDQSY
jgi:hypothetical protein